MKTITFYSYKGGVGRSLTLANMAARLAEFGKKVCMLDFDLEAPGLHLKFQNEIKQPITLGLVDYIHAYAADGVLPGKIAPYSIPLTLYNNKDVHLIPAGNIDDNNYWRNLSAIDWYDLVYDNPDSISFFLDLKQKIKKELNPDFLLVDSRTGISEMSGITISLLADEVVIVSANNRENLMGSKRIIDFLTNNEKPILGGKLPVSFVLSRIPSPDSPSEKGEEQLLIASIKEQLPTIPAEHFFILHSDRDLELKEERRIGYDIESGTNIKKSIEITKEYLALFEHLTEGVLTPEEKIKFSNNKKSQRLLIEAVRAPISDKKIAFLNDALELNPKNTFAKIELARTYIDIGKIDEGLHLYENALQLDSNQHVLMYANLAFAYNKNSKLNEANDTYNKMINLFPNERYIAYQGIGNNMYDVGQYEEAIEYFTKALIEKSDEWSYNGRASTYRHLGNYEAALRDIFKALEINPEFAIAYTTLAEIYLMQGKMSEFYLNLETAFSKNVREVAKLLPQEKIYARVVNEERFKNLLEKYDVLIPVYES